LSRSVVAGRDLGGNSPSASSKDISSIASWVTRVERGKEKSPREMSSAWPFLMLARCLHLMFISRFCVRAARMEMWCCPWSAEEVTLFSQASVVLLSVSTCRIGISGRPLGNQASIWVHGALLSRSITAAIWRSTMMNSRQLMWT
jgi:hypothetical protein